MSVSVEKKEKNTAVLTIEVAAEKFAEAVEKAYRKQKGSITIPGFRKGKAPRKMIEKLYGKGVFYEEAANTVLQETYEDAAKESGEDIVSRPQIDVTQMEEGQPFIYTATVALKPEVTLGQYKGVEVPKKEITVAIKVGAGGKAFGSVSTKEIADAAKQQLGLELDKKKMLLENPIRELGTHTVQIRLHPEVVGDLKVNVKEA